MKPLVSVIAIVLIGATGCTRKSTTAKNGPAPREAESVQHAGPGSVAAVPAAPWAQTPPSAWPQLVLTNEAQFRGRSSLQGASAFLLRNSKGTVVAATALHLLGEAGGVTPPLPLSELNSALLQWRLFPRTQPESYAVVERVAVTGPATDGRDWLLLRVAKASEMPAEPLRLRKEPVHVGETVYLVGCSYQTPDCRQDVFKGKVTDRYEQDFWKFDLVSPTEIPGFSGAPIIDSRGHVVGVTTIAFEPRMQGNKFLESGGEDVGMLYDALEGI